MRSFELPSDETPPQRSGIRQSGPPRGRNQFNEVGKALAQVVEGRLSTEEIMPQAKRCQRVLVPGDGGRDHYHDAVYR